MNNISYYEFDNEGNLQPVLRENAQRNGRFRMIDGLMVRVGEGKNAPCHYAGSDNIGGTQGILNPADGKMYDSRSAYYQAVKDAGCVVLGNDKIEPRKTTSISKKALRSGLKQAADQLGF